MKNSVITEELMAFIFNSEKYGIIGNFQNIMNFIKN